MTREEAKQFGLLLLHGIEERNTGKYAENVKLAIEALSEPSLPSNLDEAAEKHTNDSLNNLGAILRVNVSNAFKTGAEWMAEQGEIHESEIVSRITGNGLLPAATCLVDNSYREGDKVIIQVRKK